METERNMERRLEGRGNEEEGNGERGKNEQQVEKQEGGGGRRRREGEARQGGRIQKEKRRGNC